MIFGIGTDIVLVNRIDGLLARYGERFARRILGPDELVEFQRRTAKAGHGAGYGMRYLAKRFAAKEAFSKALGTGLRAPMTLRSFEVLNNRAGAPVGRWRGELAHFMEQKKLRCHVSLSDEVDTVVAFVVLETAPELS
jgi:holo-[acyl-carrier protein] synthase